MATDGMMDALLEAAEVVGPQAALASVGVSGGSFGLSNTERLHLEEGTVAGSHRAGGRARAYPDHRGVMVDEDDNIAVDEDVGTAQSNTVAKSLPPASPTPLSPPLLARLLARSHVDSVGRSRSSRSRTCTSHGSGAPPKSPALDCMRARGAPAGQRVAHVGGKPRARAHAVQRR